MEIVRSAGWALALALMVAVSSSAASPLWSSDEIRKARPVAETEAVVFHMRTETRTPGHPAEVIDRDVTLAPSFSLIVDGSRHIVEDHQLCRTFIWIDGETTFDNESCYAAVAFRAYELKNRELLARVMAIRHSIQTQYLYWCEAELGVDESGSPRLAVRKVADGSEYRLVDMLMAHTSGSVGELSAEEAHRVTRFLARYALLHPQIRRDIATSGRLPGLIESETGPTKVGEGQQVITLSGLRHTSTPFPIPSGLSSSLVAEARKGGSQRAEAVAKAAAAIDGQAPRATAAELLAALRKAVTDGRTTDATLLFLQISQEDAAALKPDGANSRLAELRTLLGPILQAPDAARIMQVNELAGDGSAKGDRQTAAQFLASALQWDTLAFGTFRHVTYANLIRISKGSETWSPAARTGMPAALEDNYWIHIAAYPWSSNTYKDLGDTYLSRYEVLDAWKAYDLGRAIDLDWREGPMAAVAGLEDQLRKREPDFF